MPKLFILIWTKCNQVFVGHPSTALNLHWHILLDPITIIFVVKMFKAPCHCVTLITELTGSKPSNSLSSTFFFLSLPSSYSFNDLPELSQVISKVDK